MPKQYDAETRAKAVRLVQDHRGDYASEYEAIRTVAGRLGMNPETLRKWLRQAEVDAGPGRGNDDGGGPGDPGAETQERGAGADRGDPEGGDVFLRAGERPATSLICGFIAEHRARFGVASICRVLY